MHETIRRLHHDAPLTDVHVHPSMKAFLFKRNLWRHYFSGSFFNPFSSRSDFKMLQKGGVGVAWATHHLMERQLFDDCFLLRAAAFLALPAYCKLVSGSLMQRTLEMIDIFERELNRRPDKTELARSVADIRRIRNEGKMAFVHAVEGAHILEGKLENLDILADRGVAYLTLAHFYRNSLTTNVDGIPDDVIIKKFCTFNFQTGGSPPLTDFGKDVLRKMKELRMMADVSHCSPAARRAIYAELNGEVPVLATHVGVAGQNPDVYNLEDDEIREIQRSGGGIGVIFYTYWLDPHHPKDGLDAIWRTMEHIHTVTNSWDSVTIGTDFDGFTDPPNDVSDASKLGKVTAMLLDRGLGETDIKKILGANALRILEQGWR